MASDREDVVAGQPILPLDLVPSAGTARDGVAPDKPAATPVAPAATPDEPAADAGGNADAAMPRAPSPRPDRGGSLLKGALAYAPAAEPIDRAAKAIVAKGKYKPVVKGPQPGPARVVAWVKWVNLRASADNKADAVATLAAGSEVNIVKCSSWCEIDAEGKRGFILRSLLSAPAAGAKPVAADRVRKTAGPVFGNPYLKPVTSNQ
jgi:hypothetical protein